MRGKRISIQSLTSDFVVGMTRCVPTLRVFVLVVGTIAVAGLFGLMALPNAAATWSGDVYNNPSTIYVGEYATITYTYTSTGTQGSTNIQHFEVSFDWMASGTYYDLGTANAIPDGGSVNFNLGITVPNSVGAHTQTITITAQATGDWFASTQTYTGTISIATRPPLTVAVQANPSTGTSPVTVTFTSTVSGGTPGYTYAWTFGDGGTSASANPTYTYDSAGTYTVTLVVTDAMGRIQSGTTTVTVQSPSSGGGSTGGGSTGGNTGGVGASSFDWTPVIAIAVIAAVVVVVVAVLVSRRKTPPLPPQSPNQPPYQPPIPPQQ